MNREQRRAFGVLPGSKLLVTRVGPSILVGLEGHGYCELDAVGAEELGAWLVDQAAQAFAAARESAELEDALDDDDPPPSGLWTPEG